MGALKFETKGDWKNTFSFLTRAKKINIKKVLEKYGKKGLAALYEATPKDTGVTASSWYYEITQGKDYSEITFCNSNAPSGVKVAVLLQYGHATRNGGWIEGIDYINPALRPIFDKLADDAWKEVTR